MSRRDTAIALVPLAAPPVVYAVLTAVLLYFPPQAWSVQQLIDVIAQLLWPVTFAFVFWSATVALSLAILLRVRCTEGPKSGVSSPVPPASTSGANGQFDFYHALYHLVTHWAAVVALIVLLIVVAGTVATASGPVRGREFVTVMVVASLSMGLYFLYRMSVFGAEELLSPQPGFLKRNTL